MSLGVELTSPVCECAARHATTLTSVCRCVNYSDPFGLLGCQNSDLVCQINRAGHQILGGLTGLLVGGGTGFGISLACAEVCSPAVVPATALAGGVLGVAAAGTAFDNKMESRAKGDLPAKGKPNSSAAKDDGNGNGQIRDYGPDGKAKTDYDFGHDHTGDGDPHAHDWDWNKIPPRQPPRPIGPNE